MPIVGILVEQISQSRPKITQISQNSIKIKVPENKFQSDISDNLDVDNQMLGSCGSYELFNSPKNALFSFVIAQYFWSFFFEHPVLRVCEFVTVKFEFFSKNAKIGPKKAKFAKGVHL